MPLAMVAIQLDAGAEQSPAQVEIATLALFQQIQPRAHRKTIVLGLQAVITR